MTTQLALALAALWIAAAPAQIDPRTALLERAGWDALAKGQAAQAADAFREALTGDPKNARLFFRRSIRGCPSLLPKLSGAGRT